MEAKVLKVSFVGDIMCELPLLKAAKTSFSEYDFDSVFLGIKKKFAQSDVVIGNLETVFAGRDAKYTNDIYSFNTPDQFADALKKSGIQYVSTANNHCLDRGIPGLLRTLDVLDERKIKHFGTYRCESERKPYEKIGWNGYRIGLITYTYNTNVAETEIVLSGDEWFHINMLQSQKAVLDRIQNRRNQKDFRHRLSKVLRFFLNDYQIVRLKSLLGSYQNMPYTDSLEETQWQEESLARLCDEVKLAKEETDFVIVSLHSGGQFNPKVGSFTEYVVSKIKEAGANAVVGHHPHIVQRCDRNPTFMAAFSLGNFSISPSSVYIIKENLPEYSIMLHFYFSSQGECKLVKTTCSILKIVENDDKKLMVIPTYDLYQDISAHEQEKLLHDCQKIYSMFVDKTISQFEMEDEYMIEPK